MAKEVNIQSNLTKDKLEKALYTEDSSELTQEEFDKLFSPLSKIGKKNEQLEKMGVKVEAKKDKKTADKLKYYEQQKQGYIYDEAKYETLKAQREISELDTKIHGTIDVIDLINNIRIENTRRKESE